VQRDVVNEVAQGPECSRFDASDRTVRRPPDRGAGNSMTGDDATRQRKLREALRLFNEIEAPVRAAEVAKELDG
jgi:hypothetical protein